MFAFVQRMTVTDKWHTDRQLMCHAADSWKPPV